MLAGWLQICFVKAFSKMSVSVKTVHTIARQGCRDWVVLDSSVTVVGNLRFAEVPGSCKGLSAKLLHPSDVQTSKLDPPSCLAGYKRLKAMRNKAQCESLSGAVALFSTGDDEDASNTKKPKMSRGDQT